MRTKPVVDTSELVVEGLPPRSAASAANRAAACAAWTTSGVEEIRRRAAARTSASARGQVYACPQAFDGLSVTFVGEVIGDVLHRDGGVWVQVNDDDYALEVGPMGRHDEHRGFNTGLAVWLPDGLHEHISGVGRPDRRGDVLLLQGIVLRADPEDGGGTHPACATRREVVAPSVELDEPLHVPQAIVAACSGDRGGRRAALVPSSPTALS